MIFFKTRQAARNFAKGAKKVLDMGKDSAKRWAVKVI